MKFSKLQLTIPSFLKQKHYFLITYFFFLLGFFVVPSTRWHNNIFYGLILFPYLITLQLKRIQLICRSNIWLLSMFLCSYMCLTLLWADNAVFKDYVYHLRRLVYLFVFLSLTIELVLTYPKFIDYLFTFLCWVAAITAIVSILWFYSSISFHLQRLSYLGDQVRNPVVGASVYGMIAIICCFHFLKTKKSYAWIYIVLSVVILFSVVLTQSRGPLGALLITFLIGAVLTKNKKLLAAVLCVILVGGLMFFYIEGSKEMIISRGLSYRLEICQQTLSRIKEALFFGEGISTENTFIMTDGSKWNHPHNVYLGTTLYGGLIGLFLLVVLQAMTLWEGFVCFLRENDFTYVALLLFAFICITIMNDRVVNHPDALWMYFWLPLALLAAKKLSSEEAIKSFYHKIDETKCKE
jgi:O-antigen ligase